MTKFKVEINQDVHTKQYKFQELITPGVYQYTEDDNQYMIVFASTSQNVAKVWFSSRTNEIDTVNPGVWDDAIFTKLDVNVNIDIG